METNVKYICCYAMTQKRKKHPLTKSICPPKKNFSNLAGSFVAPRLYLFLTILWNRYSKPNVTILSKNLCTVHAVVVLCALWDVMYGWIFYFWFWLLKSITVLNRTLINFYVTFLIVKKVSKKVRCMISVLTSTLVQDNGDCKEHRINKR